VHDQEHHDDDRGLDRRTDSVRRCDDRRKHHLAFGRLLRGERDGREYEQHGNQQTQHRQRSAWGSAC